MDEIDEIARQRELREAGHAQQLLDNPVWTDTITGLKKDLFDTWRTSAAGDKALREELYLTYLVAESIERRFEDLVETGGLAATQLEDARNHGNTESSAGSGRQSPGRARFSRPDPIADADT